MTLQTSTGQTFGTRVRKIIENPVVMRDLRAQMRGTKSYWYQGIFLLLLGVIAIAGYASATGQNMATLRGEPMKPISIVNAQSQLSQFYMTIFGALACLVILIAPALTASSVVGERQRLSFDLLVTTPLSAGQMLWGKLISSTAFLLLLLALSLPATALCIMLGGATVSDVLRSYLILAVDGLVLAGIGLFFSCAVRVPLLAVIWTYGTVLAYMCALGTFAGTLFNMDSEVRDATTLGHALVGLMPLSVVSPTEMTTMHLGPIGVPSWVLTCGFAALALRLLITASEYRLGLYGANSVRSLRRQTLFCLALVAYAVCNSGGNFGGVLITRNHLTHSLGIGLLLSFLVGLPFLISLFVPASSEDAPPGVTESAVPTTANGALYRPARLFAPDASGALPYFHLAFATFVISGLLGFSLSRNASDFNLFLFLAPLTYVGALGFLVWAICRYAARLTQGLSSARAIAFGILAGIVAAPMMGLAFVNGTWSAHPLSYLWILRPLSIGGTAYPFFEACCMALIPAVLLGTLFLYLDVRAGKLQAKARS